MNKKKYILLSFSLIFIIAAAVLLTKYSPGVKKPDNKANKPAEEKMDFAHQMPKGLEKDLIKNVKSNLKTLESVREDTSSLDKVLSGDALSKTKSLIDLNLKNNIVTFRKFDDIELSVSNYTKGIASVLLEFTDGSYTYDRVSNKHLTKPANSKKKLALSVTKVGKTWKITGIYNTTAFKNSAEPVKKQKK